MQRGDSRWSATGKVPLHSSKYTRGEDGAYRQFQQFLGQCELAGKNLSISTGTTSVGMGLASIRPRERDQAREQRSRGAGWTQGPSLLII